MKIINAKIYNTEKKDFYPDVLCFTDVIGDDRDGQTVDASGCLAVPGYVDVHTHGRGGVDVMRQDADFESLAMHYAVGGATSVYPTVMTNPTENILSSIKNIAKNADKCPISFDGVHIEGPYISKHAPGCHMLEYIRPLSDTAEVGMFIDAAEGMHVHLTVAPESDGASEFIEYCIGRGATVGIGHTKATYEQCLDAIRCGCVSFTHTFNAMSPLSHRQPGAVGASLLSDAYSEFICDGFHLHPDIIKLGYRAKGEDLFVIVTDSLPPAGLPDGRYSLAGLPVNVNGKRILTDDGTIAGSGISMHDSVLNLMKFTEISYGKAVACATANPAKQVGIYGVCGSLDNGKRADILLVDEKTLEIKQVYAKGKRIL